MSTIGVLAVQGAFASHAAVLEELGHRVVLVRRASDFGALDGLVLPGGESTVQLELSGRLGLEAGIRELAHSGRPLLATCAGLILLATEVTDPGQRSFGAIDVSVARNGWGRQVDSFEASSDETFGGGQPLPIVCIRAPRIKRVGMGVEVLARFAGEPVLVHSGNLVGATFHPELTSDRRVHRYVFGPHARAGSVMRYGAGYGQAPCVVLPAS